MTNIVLRYAARSDVGLTRSNNQDSGYAGPNLMLVADGMGGHAGGDVAASLAVARISELDVNLRGGDIAAHVENAILDANDEILRQARQDPKLAGLGTTVTALLRHDDRFVLAHIGDSRAYLLRQGQLAQITKDHTFVQRLVDEGRITQEEAETHPQRNVVMRVLGDVDADPVLDISLRQCTPGDRWMLCSDGLSGVVSHDTIAETMRDFPEIGLCADELVRLALRGGGPDNITVVIADVLDLDAYDGPDLDSQTQVVGSAALDARRPTRATGAAARAAALMRPQEAPQEDFEPEHLRKLASSRRRLPLLIGLIALVIFLVAAAVGGYYFTQSQYYVGINDGKVAIYKGVAQEIGPLKLSHVEKTEDIEVSDLPKYQREQLAASPIGASSLADAEKVVQSLRVLMVNSAVSGDSLTSPSASPSASPTVGSSVSTSDASPTPGVATLTPAPSSAPVTATLTPSTSSSGGQ